MGAQPLKSSGKVVTETGKKITDGPFGTGNAAGVATVSVLYLLPL